MADQPKEVMRNALAHGLVEQAGGTGPKTRAPQLRAREALVTMAEEIHRGHAHHHPPGTTWRGCVSETCERSRRLAWDVEWPGEIGGGK